MAIDVDLTSFDFAPAPDDDWGNVFAIDLGRWRPELHPRDSHGRFRNTWRMPDAAMRQVERLLAGFNPPALRSDRHASSYLRGQRGPRSKKQQESLDYFLSRAGNEDIQSTLRAKYDPARDKEVPQSGHIRELDGMMKPLEHDLILSRVMGPDAFGLPPERLGEVEEWTGRRVSDAGFSPMNVGTPHQIGAPHIEMRVLAPRGTRAIIVGDGGDGPNSRTVILDRNQPLRISSVQSDGRGGFYALATVGPSRGAKGEQPTTGLGRELPVSQRSPAIEATPDEFQRRGLEPEAPPGPQAQPGRFGPATPAGPAPTQRAVPGEAPPPPSPAPEGPPLEQPAPTKAIREAGGAVPTGAGHVTTQEDVNAPEAPPAPRERPRTRGQGPVMDEQQARLQTQQRLLEADQKRLDAQRAQVERREQVYIDRLERENERLRAQEEKARTDREAAREAQTIRADEGTRLREEPTANERDNRVVQADEKHRKEPGWPHTGEDTRIARHANEIRRARGEQELPIPENAPPPPGEEPAPTKRVRKAIKKAAPEAAPEAPTPAKRVRKATKTTAAPEAAPEAPPEVPPAPVKQARKVAKAAPEVAPEAPAEVPPAKKAARVVKKAAPEVPPAKAAPAKRAARRVPEGPPRITKDSTPEEIQRYLDYISPPPSEEEIARRREEQDRRLKEFLKPAKAAPEVPAKRAPAKRGAKKAAAEAPEAPEKAARPTVKRAAKKAVPEAAPEAPAKKAPAKRVAKKTAEAAKAAPAKKAIPERKPKTMAELEAMSDEEIIKYADGLEGPSQNSSEVVAKRMAQAAKNRIAEGAPPGETLDQLKERLTAPRKEARKVTRAVPTETADQLRDRLKRESTARAQARAEAERKPRPPSSGMTPDEIREQSKREAAAAHKARLAEGPRKTQAEAEAEQKLPRKGLKKAESPAVKRRADNFDKATPDVPGQEGGLLRLAQKRLAEGQPVAPIKQDLLDRADFHRRNAELEREDPVEIDDRRARHYDRLAEIYENAANAIGKRGANPERLAPGDKVERTNKDKSITKGTVAKRGRLTYIDWEDGESQRVLPSRPGRGIKKVGSATPGEVAKAEKPRTLTDLRKEAGDLGVPGRSTMDRDKLTEAIDARRQRPGESDEDHKARLSEMNARPKVTRAAPRKVARAAAPEAAPEGAPEAPAKKAAPAARRAAVRLTTADQKQEVGALTTNQRNVYNDLRREGLPHGTALGRAQEAPARKVAVRKAAAERPTVKRAPKKLAQPSTEDRAAKALLDAMPPQARKEILDSMTPEERAGVQEAVARVEGAKAARPVVKRAAAAKKAATKLADLTPAQRRQYTDLSPSEQASYRAFLRNGRSHDDALQGARDMVNARTVKAAKAAAGEVAPRAPRRVAKKAAREIVPAAESARKAAPKAAEKKLAKIVPGNVKEAAPQKRAPKATGVQAPTKAAKVARPRVKRAAPAPVAEVPETPTAVARNSKADYLPGGSKHLDISYLVDEASFGRVDVPGDSGLDRVPDHRDVLKEAQQQLDEGQTPGQVGRNLQLIAARIRSSAATRFGDFNRDFMGADEIKDLPPDVKAARLEHRANKKATYEAWQKRAKQLADLGGALEKLSRPRVARKAAVKAAPEAPTAAPVKKAARKVAKAAPTPPARLQRSPRLTPEQRSDIEPLNSYDKARYRSLRRDHISHDDALAQTKRERQAADLTAARNKEAAATERVRKAEATKAEAAARKTAGAKQLAAIEAENQKELTPLLREAGVNWKDLSDVQRAKVGVIKNRVEKRTLTKKRAAEMLREGGDDRMDAIASVLERRAPRKVAAKAAPAAKRVAKAAAPAVKKVAPEGAPEVSVKPATYRQQITAIAETKAPRNLPPAAKFQWAAAYKSRKNKGAAEEIARAAGDDAAARSTAAAARNAAPEAPAERPVVKRAARKVAKAAPEAPAAKAAPAKKVAKAAPEAAPITLTPAQHQALKKIDSGEQGFPRKDLQDRLVAAGVVRYRNGKYEVTPTGKDVLARDNKRPRVTRAAAKAAPEAPEAARTRTQTAKALRQQEQVAKDVGDTQTAKDMARQAEKLETPPAKKGRTRLGPGGATAPAGMPEEEVARRRANIARAAARKAPGVGIAGNPVAEEDTVKIRGLTGEGIVEEVLPDGRVRVLRSYRKGRDLHNDSRVYDRDQISLIRKGNKDKDLADSFLGGKDIAQATRESERLNRQARTAAKKAAPEAAPEAPVPAKRVRKVAAKAAPEAPVKVAERPVVKRAAAKKAAEAAPEVLPPTKRVIRERKPTPVGQKSKLTERLEGLGGDHDRIQAELDKDHNNKLDLLREVADDLGVDRMQPKDDLKRSIVEAMSGGPKKRARKVARPLETSPLESSNVSKEAPAPRVRGEGALKEGRITRSRIQPGTRLVGELTGENGFKATRSKTRGTPLEVTSVERVKPEGNRRGLVKITAKTADGREVTSTGGASETHMLEPEGGYQPPLTKSGQPVKPRRVAVRIPERIKKEPIPEGADPKEYQRARAMGKSIPVATGWATGIARAREKLREINKDMDAATPSERVKALQAKWEQEELDLIHKIDAPVPAPERPTIRRAARKVVSALRRPFGRERTEAKVPESPEAIQTARRRERAIQLREGRAELARYIEQEPGPGEERGWTGPESLSGKQREEYDALTADQKKRYVRERDQYGALTGHKTALLLAKGGKLEQPEKPIIEAPAKKVARAPRKVAKATKAAPERPRVTRAAKKAAPEAAPEAPVKRARKVAAKAVPEAAAPERPKVTRAGTKVESADDVIANRGTVLRQPEHPGWDIVEHTGNKRWYILDPEGNLHKDGRISSSSSLELAKKRLDRINKPAAPEAPAKAARKVAKKATPEAAPERPRVTRAAKKAVPEAGPRLTTTQQRVVDQVSKASADLRRESSTDGGWVGEHDIAASRGTLQRLVDKGHLEMEEVPGRRKGTVGRQYRPTGVGAPEAPAKRVRKVAAKAAPEAPTRPRVTRAAKKAAPEAAPEAPAPVKRARKVAAKAAPEAPAPAKRVRKAAAKAAPEAAPEAPVKRMRKAAAKTAGPDTSAEQARLRSDLMALSRTKNGGGVRRRRLSDRLIGLETADHAEEAAPADLTPAQRRLWAKSYRNMVHDRGFGHEAANQEANIDVVKDVLAKRTPRGLKKAAAELVDAAESSAVPRRLRSTPRPSAEALRESLGRNRAGLEGKLTPNQTKELDGLDPRQRARYWVRRLESGEDHKTALSKAAPEATAKKAAPEAPAPVKRAPRKVAAAKKVAPEAAPEAPTKAAPAKTTRPRLSPDEVLKGTKGKTRQDQVKPLLDQVRTRSDMDEVARRMGITPLREGDLRARRAHVLNHFNPPERPVVKRAVKKAVPEAAPEAPAAVKRAPRKVAKAAPEAPQKAVPRGRYNAALKEGMSGPEAEAWARDGKQTIANMRTERQAARKAVPEAPAKATRPVVKRAAAKKVAAKAAPDVEEEARTRIGYFDKARSDAHIVSNLDQVIHDQGSDEAIRHWIANSDKPNAMAKLQGISPQDKAALQKAFDTGGREGLRKALASYERKHGLKRIGNTGDVVPFDPERHRGMGKVSGNLRPGDSVMILRPGHEAKAPGDKTSSVAEYARVMPEKATRKAAKAAAPEAPRPRVTRAAKKAVPEAPEAPTKAAPRKVAAKAAPQDRTKAARPAVKRAVKAAPEAPAQRPVVKRAAKAAAAPESKELKPLANGTRRKSMTHVQEGDVVRGATGARGGSEVPRKVTKVERDGNNITITRDDGSTLKGTANTAVWLGEAPKGEAPAAKKAAPAARKVATKAAPEAPAKATRPTVTRAAKKAAAPEAPEAPTKATRPARKTAGPSPKDINNPDVQRARRSLLGQGDRSLSDDAVASEMARLKTQDNIDAAHLATTTRKIDQNVPLKSSPEGDGGLMHGDSPSMQLAQKLARRGDRNGSANRIMELRHSYSNRQGRQDPEAAQKAVDEIRRMRLEESDPEIRKLYDQAISEMDAEHKPVPNLPDSTPPGARKLIEDLNRIPLARRAEPDHGGERISAVDELAQVYRDIDSGDIGAIRNADSRIKSILRRYHESRDGAYQMWDLQGRTEQPGRGELGHEIRQWIRERYAAGGLEAPAAKRATPAAKKAAPAAPEAPTPRPRVTRAKKAAPEAPAVRSTEAPTPGGTRVSQAQKRLEAREAYQRRSTADGSAELADILNQVVEARQGNDNPVAFRRAVRQRLMTTPGEKGDPKTEGYSDLRRALERETFTTPEELNTRLRQELAKRGITMTSTPGAQTRFNPDLHRAVGADIPDNADVEVIRPGLVFTDKDGTVVTLQKPVVRRVEGKKSGPLSGSQPSLSTLDRAVDRIFGPPPKKARPTAPPAVSHRSTQRPLTGEASLLTGDIFSQDTDPRGVPVRDFTSRMGGGYTIKNGTAWRRNGVTYVVEHEETGAGKRAALAAAKALEAHHQSLPAGARHYQRAYSWHMGSNPQDPQIAKKLKRDSFTSVATAGEGDTFIWQPGVKLNSNGEVDVTQLMSDMNHEYGHNADIRLPSGTKLSSTKAWHEAGQTDVPSKVINPRTWQPSSAHGGRAEGIVMEHDPHAFYPGGVTRYGRSNEREDFAEAVDLYLQGRIGYGELKSQPGFSYVWFRDLFPARAAILDRLFPEVAQRQLAEIAELEAGPTRRRVDFS